MKWSFLPRLDVEEIQIRQVALLRLQPFERGTLLGSQFVLDLADDTNSWVLGPDGKWVRIRSVKRVAAAVGEGSMAVRLVFEHLEANGLATTAASGMS